MSASVVLGYNRTKYSFQDGTSVEGYNLYCASPIDRDSGSGQYCERVFMSDSALQRVGFEPSVGAKVDVQYNHKGKRVVVSVLK